jgi:hypothetical protein
MRDIVENEFSPFTQVSATGKLENISRTIGLPIPPKTRDIMRLAPGSSIQIVRVISYTDKLGGGGTMEFAKVSTFVSWCGNNRQFKIETKRFQTPRSTK